MSSLLTILMLVVFLACVASLYTEGMWSVAIRLIDVVTAALLATNFFEPVARWLDDWQPSGTYVWDFLALWGLFGVFITILRLLTDRVSQVRVRFLKVVDQIGGAFFAVLVGWAFVCFTMMTLHTAPLAKSFLFGGFNSEERMFLGLAPDRQWLGFTQRLSRGAFCRSATDAEVQQEQYVFDPHNEFIAKYATRRAALEANVAQYNSIQPGSGGFGAGGTLPTGFPPPKAN